MLKSRFKWKKIDHVKIKASSQILKTFLSNPNVEEKSDKGEAIDPEPDLSKPIYSTNNLNIRREIDGKIYVYNGGGRKLDNLGEVFFATKVNEDVICIMRKIDLLNYRIHYYAFRLNDQKVIIKETYDYIIPVIFDLKEEEGNEIDNSIIIGLRNNGKSSVVVQQIDISTGDVKKEINLTLVSIIKGTEYVSVFKLPDNTLAIKGKTKLGKLRYIVIPELEFVFRNIKESEVETLNTPDSLQEALNKFNSI